MEEEQKDQIEIFSTDDKKIKAVGELLTNDSSRTILQLLFKEELSATQIAQKTDISLQLVKYHLNKMHDLDIVRISKVEKNIKNQDMNFYSATKFAIVIVPSEVSQRAKESKLLVRSFKTIYRLVGFGIAAAASWFVLGSDEDVPMRGGETSTGIEPLQVIIPISIVVAAIVIEAIILSRKRKESTIE